jgi:C1A family cysteine protease
VSSSPTSSALPPSLGWRPPSDFGRVHRGARRRLTASEVAGLKPVIDLSALAPTVFNQGPLGSCVGQAVAKALEVALARAHRAGLAPRAFIPSRLALYYGAREAIGTTPEDSGAIIADCLLHAKRIGFADEAYWDYVENLGSFAVRPPYDYYDAAAESRLVTSEPLDHDGATVHWELASGHVVLAGMFVDEGFYEPTGDTVVPRGDVLGGHAVAVVGIDMPNRRVRIMNSWGTDWGAAGFAWFPLDALLDPSRTGELHAVRAVRVRKDMPPVAERVA